MKLQLTHYAKKGIYAYLCPVSVENSEIKRGAFLNGSPIEGEESAYYKGKAATVEFDLDSFEGWHEFKEAIGHRPKTGFIKIEGGRITQEIESKDELIDLLNPVSDLQLPPLEGSDRQIAWAEKIRATAIRGGFPIERAAKFPQAKIWIDSREKLAKYGVKS